MKKLVGFVILICIIASIYSLMTGALDPTNYNYSFPSPELIDSKETKVKFSSDIIFKLKQKFNLKSVILCLKVDNQSEYSPMVMTLGWNKMSIGKYIQAFKMDYTYFGGRRATIDRSQVKLDISGEEFETSICNAYIIPKNNIVKKKLLSLKQYNAVKISGYLVHILTPGGTKKLSTDFNEFVCKYMYIDDIEILK